MKTAIHQANIKKGLHQGNEDIFFIKPTSKKVFIRQMKTTIHQAYIKKGLHQANEDHYSSSQHQKRSSSGQ
ncbi:hypothetical protein ACIQ34_02490 [Ureibacillus sp. NPDC094379]